MTARVILDNVGADSASDHDDRAEVDIFAGVVSLAAFDFAHVGDDPALLHFTPAKARALASALLDKADELEGKP